MSLQKVWNAQLVHTQALTTFKLIAVAAIIGVSSGAVIPPNFQPSFHGLQPLVSNPSSQQVTSSQAFSTGAGNTNNANYDDGTGNGGSDTYNCYYGSYTGFPDKSKWIQFDAMFNNAKSAMKSSCANLGSSAFGPGDSDQQIGLLWNSIQQVAEASLVDHRFILAVIMQEVCHPPFFFFLFSEAAMVIPADTRKSQLDA